MSAEKSSILLVDDRPENLFALEELLEPFGQNLVRATSGEEALRCLLERDFALILLDVQMPGMDGFETARHIKLREKTRDLPIIFLTAFSRDAQHQLRGYALGAVDYLAKPFDPWVLQSKVKIFLDLHDKKAQLKEQADLLRQRLDEREDAERALARKTRELERSNAELEHFASIASHDLQEPLRVVVGYLDLLSQPTGEQLDEAKAKEVIERALEAAWRMSDLIRDLLAYARVGTRGEALQPMSVEAALEDAMESLGVALEESGGTVTHDPLPTVAADPTQLSQLLSNLLSNAIKFRGDRAPAIHVGARRRGDTWVVAVTDNGIGVRGEDAERIFTIFERAHTGDKHPGTGIGLAICKRIVERHGGHIWLESEPGEGATFYFTLPVADEGRPDGD